MRDDLLVTRILLRRFEDLAGSQDVDALLGLGCDLADAGLNEEAAACFQRAGLLGFPVGWFDLGNVLIDLGRLPAAAEALERAGEGGEPDAWLNLGHVLSELGDGEAAVRAYRAAKEAGDPNAPLALAFALREHGDRAAAHEAATAAADEGDATAAAVVACWDWCTSHDPALEPALRAGADLFPATRADLADLLIQTGRTAEGRAVLERGVELGEVEALLPLGNLCASLGEFAAAEDAYLKDIASGDIFGHNNLANLYLERGDERSAADQFRIGADKGDALAAQNLLEMLADDDPDT